MPEKCKGKQAEEITENEIALKKMSRIKELENDTISVLNENGVLNYVVGRQPILKEEN